MKKIVFSLAITMCIGLFTGCTASHPNIVMAKEVAAVGVVTNIQVAFERADPTAGFSAFSSTQAITEIIPQQDRIAETQDSGIEEGKQKTETQIRVDAYKAIYTQAGENYTLIADSITKSFLILENKNKSIRQTNYHYISYFEDFPSKKTPILGSLNNWFVFLAHNELVASDGKKEWVLQTIGEASLGEKLQTGRVIYSKNRILVEIFQASEKVLFIIDLNAMTAEKYTGLPYIDEVFAFTENYLCFSTRHKIQGSGYYNNLYTLYEGNLNIIGVIGGFDEYTLENDVVKMKHGTETFDIDLKTNQLTSSMVIDDEFRLYYPVYCETTVDVPEMKLINKNTNDQIQSIGLPDLWSASCYYYMDYWSYFITTKDTKEKANLWSEKIGYFRTAEHSEKEPEKFKFPDAVKVKELLYSGPTNLGNGEVYLIERSEPYRIAEEQQLYEIIYAWVPIKGESKAYQIGIYVPRGEEVLTYFNLVKTILRLP